jgi:hypothetical protein
MAAQAALDQALTLADANAKARFELILQALSNARNLWMSVVGAYPPGELHVQGIE